MNDFVLFCSCCNRDPGWACLRFQGDLLWGLWLSWNNNSKTNLARPSSLARQALSCRISSSAQQIVYQLGFAKQCFAAYGYHVTRIIKIRNFILHHLCSHTINVVTSSDTMLRFSKGGIRNLPYNCLWLIKWERIYCKLQINPARERVCGMLVDEKKEQYT